MKLQAEAIARIFALRQRRMTYDAIAAELRLPRHLVALVIKHAAKVKGRRENHVIDIPETGPGVWKCDGCGAVIEAAPCVYCCGQSTVRIVRRRRPALVAAVEVAGIRCYPSRLRVRGLQ